MELAGLALHFVDRDVRSIRSYRDSDTHKMAFGGILKHTNDTCRATHIYTPYASTHSHGHAVHHSQTCVVYIT